MTEMWKPIPEYEDYEVSDFGQVYSLKCGRLLKSDLVTGYPTVALYRGGHRQNFMIHHLVLEAFVGPPPEGQQCNHKDGDRTNNRAENLEWVTPSENIQHAIEVLGRGRSGSDHGNAKLTEDEVREIRRLYEAGGWSQRALADVYGIRQAYVSAIVRHKAWRHV